MNIRIYNFLENISLLLSLHVLHFLRNFCDFECLKHLVPGHSELTFGRVLLLLFEFLPEELLIKIRVNNEHHCDDRNNERSDDENNDNAHCPHRSLSIERVTLHVNTETHIRTDDEQTENASDIFPHENIGSHHNGQQQESAHGNERECGDRRHSAHQKNAHTERHRVERREVETHFVPHRVSHQAEGVSEEAEVVGVSEEFAHCEKPNTQSAQNEDDFENSELWRREPQTQ